MIDATRPDDVRALLDQPAQRLRAEIGALLPVSLLAHAVMAAPGMLLLPFVDPSDIVQANGMLDMRSMAVTYAAGLVGFIAYVPGYLAISEAVRARMHGAPVTSGAMWAAAASPRNLGATLLSLVLVGVGILMCAVPGLAAAVAFALLTPVLLEERPASIGASFKRALALARAPLGATPTWLLAGLILVVSVFLGWVCGFVIALPAALWSGYASIEAATQGRIADASAVVAPNWLTALITVANVLLRSMVDLYPIVGMFHLYGIVTRRGGGDDLAALVARQTGTTT